MIVQEDFSIEATKGFILYELSTKGACTHQYFTQDADEDYLNELKVALDDLLKDDSILRKGQVFYLPRNLRDYD